MAPRRRPRRRALDNVTAGLTHVSELLDDFKHNLLQLARWLARSGHLTPEQMAEIETRWAAVPVEPTTTPEDALSAAGVSSRRQAAYQRRMSSLLAQRAPTAAPRIARR